MTKNTSEYFSRTRKNCHARALDSFLRPRSHAADGCGWWSLRQRRRGSRRDDQQGGGMELGDACCGVCRTYHGYLVSWFEKLGGITLGESSNSKSPDAGWTYNCSPLVLHCGITVICLEKHHGIRWSALHCGMNNVSNKSLCFVELICSSRERTLEEDRGVITALSREQNGLCSPKVDSVVELFHSQCCEIISRREIFIFFVGIHAFLKLGDMPVIGLYVHVLL